MRRNFALPGGTRSSGRCATSSCACLAFVVVLGLAFWAAAVWVGGDVLTAMLSSR
jgi:hypothetical protein